MTVGFAESGGEQVDPPSDLNGRWELKPGTESKGMPECLTNTMTISKAVDAGFYADLECTYMSSGCCVKAHKTDLVADVAARSQPQPGAYEGNSAQAEYVFVTVSYDLIRFSTTRKFRGADGWSCEYEKAV